MDIKWSVNSYFELIKYYNASLGSHPKQTLIAAIKRGYFKKVQRFDGGESKYPHWGGVRHGSGTYARLAKKCAVHNLKNKPG